MAGRNQVPVSVLTGQAPPSLIKRRASTIKKQRRRTGTRSAKVTNNACNASMILGQRILILRQFTTFAIGTGCLGQQLAHLIMQRLALTQEVPNRAKRDAQNAGAQTKVERDCGRHNGPQFGSSADSPHDLPSFT